MARNGERPKRTWKKRRHHEPKPEHGKRGDQHGGELGEIAVDLAGIAGDGIGIRRGERARELDLALDDAQALPFGTGGIGAARQALVGGDVALARQRRAADQAASWRRDRAAWRR